MTSLAGIRPLICMDRRPTKDSALGEIVLELFVQSYSILFALREAPRWSHCGEMQGTLEALLFTFGNI